MCCVGKCFRGQFIRSSYFLKNWWFFENLANMIILCVVNIIKKVKKYIVNVKVLIDILTNNFF